MGQQDAVEQSRARLATAFSVIEASMKHLSMMDVVGILDDYPGDMDNLHLFLMVIGSAVDERQSRDDGEEDLMS